MTQGILRTKIIPPPRHTRTLARPRVTDLLMQAFDHRLTILQAEAGYGKSTALSELAETVKPLAWYQVNEEDCDPLIFLLHLCHAFLRAVPDLEDLPVHFLETWDGSQGPLPWRSVTDQIINTLSGQLDNPTLLVLDDAHIVADSGETAHIIDRLFGMAPAKLHVLLSGRPVITLAEKIRLFSYATSLGHAHSLLFYYPTDMYIDAMPFYTDEQKRRIREWTGDGIIRASLGLESADDLIRDLDRALRARTFKGLIGPLAYAVMKKM